MLRIKELESKIGLMHRSDLKGKNFKDLVIELELNANEESQLLLDRISLFDITVCDSCGDIVDSIDEVRYCGYDFVFKNPDANVDGFSMCDSCISSETNNINFIVD